MKMMLNSIGVASTGNVTMSSGSEMYIGVDITNTDLLRKINFMIDEEKRKYCIDYEQIMKKNNLLWSKKDVVLKPSIKIICPGELEKENKLSVELSVFFQDAENDELFSDITIPLEIKEKAILKKIVVDAVANYFFGTKE